MTIEQQILTASIYEHEKAIKDLSLAMGHLHPTVIELHKAKNEMTDKLKLINK
tara:strand:- start:1163 stop:1321 length:159 start_codon:yes stop_codon:yes gene_type:complete